MIRIFDLVSASLGLLVLSPLFLIFSFFVWYEDKHTPFYISKRVGKGGVLFNLIKFRSMRMGADKTGVDSTSTNDERITPIGHMIRRFKIDELPQLFNVLSGSMSFVGPRPNVQREVVLYTAEEKKLLSIKSGITSISSIVFSDEGDILSNYDDPDIAYNQLIRPWKNKLDLFYVEKHSLSNSIFIIFTTLVALVSKASALNMVHSFLIANNADQDLINAARRAEPLKPSPPPGSNEIVTSRV